MDIEHQALLSTVDRVLQERGSDPELVAPEDKINMAVQYVQLYAVQERLLEDTARRLAQILKMREDMALPDLMVAMERVFIGGPLRV